jgi:hypothetical protein
VVEHVLSMNKTLGSRYPTADKWIKILWYIYTMEYYSVIRNNDMWFEGTWIQLEDILLSEVSQDQKHKSHMCSLKHGRSIQR